MWFYIDLKLHMALLVSLQRHWLWLVHIVCDYILMSILSTLFKGSEDVVKTDPLFICPMHNNTLKICV